MPHHICENPRCTYHREIAPAVSGAPYIDTFEDGDVVRVERHPYLSHGGQREFFLCDVCHEAVQMVVTPNA